MYPDLYTTYSSACHSISDNILSVWVDHAGGDKQSAFFIFTSDRVCHNNCNSTYSVTFAVYFRNEVFLEANRLYVEKCQ